MQLHVERIVGGGVHLEEALRRALRFEALHLSLTIAGSRDVNLGAVVVSQKAGTMTIDEAKTRERGKI